jgi:hypothetical protein
LGEAKTSPAPETLCAIVKEVNLKKILIFISLLSICFTGYADDRPTIYSLINKKIFISDNFAGQSITLVKELNKYYIIRDFFGSGIPIINTLKYSVEFNSNYQIRFSNVINGKKPKKFENFKEEFVLSVISETEIRLYLNGLQIVIK